MDFGGSVYHFYPDGSIFRAAMQRVATNSEIFNQLATNVTIKINNLFSFLNHNYPFHLIIKNNHALIATKLDKIKLNTTYSISSDGRLIPEFRDGAQFLKLSIDWPATEGMKFYFGVLVNDYRNISCILPNKAFFFATKTSVAGYWRLPLPNLYEDGAICLGREFDNVFRASTWQHLMDKALELFYSATWATDLLLDGPEKYQKMFQFNLPNHEPFYPTRFDWTSVCRKVNSQYLEEIHECFN